MVPWKSCRPSEDMRRRWENCETISDDGECSVAITMHPLSARPRSVVTIDSAITLSFTRRHKGSEHVMTTAAYPVGGEGSALVYHRPLWGR
jgi:hypothetical protein